MNSTRRSSTSEARRGGAGNPADFCDAAGMSTVGYARVSTDHQSVLAQRDALTAAGCGFRTGDLGSVRRPGPRLSRADTVLILDFRSATERLAGSGRSREGTLGAFSPLPPPGPYSGQAQPAGRTARHTGRGSLEAR